MLLTAGKVKHIFKQTAVSRTDEYPLSFMAYKQDLRATIIFVDLKFKRVDFAFTIDSADRTHLEFVAAVSMKIAEIEEMRRVEVYREMGRAISARYKVSFEVDEVKV
jgi:hypothetical protein